MEILGFLRGFFNIGKVSFSAKVPFQPHWWVEIFLRKNFLVAGFENFHIFYAKKRPFFRFLDPRYFRAGGPIFFFGISLIFLHRKKFTGLVPPHRWTCNFFDFFSLFPKEIHFPIEKKKRRRRRRKKKIMPRRRRPRGFFLIFFNFLMKAPFAPPALCAAGQPDRWRRYKAHPAGEP